MPRSYGTTNVAPYPAAPAVGPAGDTYYNTANKVLYLSDGSVWNPNAGTPAGGTADQVLQKNSATDYDDSWTSIIGANAGISRIVATGNNTFGQIDGQRINGAGAMAGLQNAFNFRGLGYDGVSAYRVLGSVSLGTDVAAVTPTNAGGTVTFNTTANGTLTNTGRVRIDGAGMVEIASKLKVGQALASAGLTGSALDLSNGLLNMRRQAYAVTSGFLNDLTLPTSSFIEFTGATGSCVISGFAGGIDGAVINFLYTGTQPFSLLHQQTSATANQIYIPTAVTVYASGPFAGTLIYSTSLSKWILTYFSADQFQASGTVVSEQSRGYIGGWGTTASTTYVVISGSFIPIVNFVKRYAGTTLELSMGASAYVTGTVGPAQFGCSTTNAPANVTQVSQFYWNALSSHAAFTGLTNLTGLAAGTYACSWWLKVTNAATTVTNDASDLIWTRIREIWP
jgi:hypothetical protein